MDSEPRSAEAALNLARAQVLHIRNAGGALEPERTVPSMVAAVKKLRRHDDTEQRICELRDVSARRGESDLADAVEGVRWQRAGAGLWPPA